MRTERAYDYAEHVIRRKNLVEAVKQTHADRTQGVIVLFAGFEPECSRFLQESSFFYYTGICEPGVALIIDLQGSTTLYVPNCGSVRAKWVAAPLELTQKNSAILGVDRVEHLGQQCTGYQIHPFFPRHEYEQIIEALGAVVARGGSMFTLTPDTPHQYIEQRLLLERLKVFIPNLTERLVDISPLVAHMRRIKSAHELEQMYQAIGITALAQEAAAKAIAEGVNECEVQASLEYMMTGSCAHPSFPSIVASGPNSTVLHYTVNNRAMKAGDLVVVDIGAEYEHYCADITRTYPVSGTFTPRQRELYELVLATQEYIAGLAKPGMWLSNKEHPEESLNHLAKKYLADKGYGNYFPHGIGHFLGLDVHDVGDATRPLQTGDVITIEPGIYIPEEGIGIRIEDNYWIIDDGVVCLSEDIPKHPHDIEMLVKESLEAGSDQVN